MAIERQPQKIKCKEDIPNQQQLSSKLSSSGLCPPGSFPMSNQNDLKQARFTDVGIPTL